MKKFIRKVAVMTSGGDAPGMNAAIRAVVRSCAYYKLECVGIYRGYQGMIEGDIVPMSARDVHHIIQKGGTVLKSARSDEFRTIEGRKLSLIHISEPTRRRDSSRMPSSA